MSALDSLKNLTPDEIVYMAATVAVALAKGLDDREILVVYQLFSSMGSMLGLIARQREFIATAVLEDTDKS